ncbi:MAG: hypothetical protein VZQ61_00625 [Christensenellaceae bacterium]
MEIPKIRNIGDIKRDNIEGVFKRWIYPKEDYSKICDYMQKINYCIQDLNNELDSLQNAGMKEIVFIISLVDWIREAFLAIKNDILEEVIKGYIFSKELEIKKAEKYFLAIRSFVVAHPLTTNRHEDYGFDGDFICVDIRRPDKFLDYFPNDEPFYYIDYTGLHKGRNKEVDFFLFSYSKKADDMKFYKKISAKFSDIYHVAELYIENLYELDKYLFKNAKYKNYKISGESI